MSNTVIKVNGLSHSYSGNQWAIRDINFEIANNGIMGLLGSNGAGKSTTMNIICGALKQTAGEVFIGDISMNQQPIDAKKNIGFLPQQAPLYLDLTVEEYLLYCIRLRGLENTHARACLEYALTKCGIRHVKDRLLKNLSGGYRQRAGIAQAIAHKPMLVILDEPTNGLDPIQIIEIRNLIKEIAIERTVILSSHILSEIQLLCDQIIMIEQGKLVFSDSMDAFNNYIAPESLVVSFENPPTVEMLAALSGIRRVEIITPRRIRLFYDGQTGTSENIINNSVRYGWRLTELAIDKNSVDKIFKQLSQKKTAH